MAEKLINIAGKLNSATVEGILAVSEQISYGDSNVKAALDELKSTSGNLQTLDVESIDMDSSTLGQIATTKKASRYILTKEGPGQQLFNCGVIDMFSDDMGHGVVQMLTTHYTMQDERLDFTTHSDDQIFQYWRYYHIGSGTSQIPAKTWGTWNVFNSSEIQTQVSTLLNRKRYVKFSTTSSIAEENIQIGSAAGTVYIYFSTQTNAFLATNDLMTGPSTKYYTSWPGVDDYGISVPSKGAVPYSNTMYISSTKDIYVWSGTELELLSSSGTVSQEFGDSTTMTISQKTLTTKINELDDAVFPTTVSLTPSPSIVEVSQETQVTLSWKVTRKGESIADDCTFTLDDEPVEGTSTQKTINESDLIQKTYTLKTTYNGKVITTTTKVNVVGAMYFGFASESDSSSLTITSLQKQSLKTSPNGTYELQNESEGDYIWLCVPNNMTINRVTLNGFDVPMEEATTKEQGTITYKCYRSSNALKTGSYPIIIS